MIPYEGFPDPFDLIEAMTLTEKRARDVHPSHVSPFGRCFHPDPRNTAGQTYAEFLLAYFTALADFTEDR